VVSERHGVWDRAIKVPGLAALNKGEQSRVVSVSCGSAGNCAAGGYYRDRSRAYQSFVANERNGVWRRAIEVPGLGTLNTAGKGEVSSVSCASAGNCAAGGYYGTRLGTRGFVAVERNGRWGRAIALPGLSALTAGGWSEVTSVSCAVRRYCAVGGHYGYQRKKPVQGFVASEQNGAWHQAIQVPGLGALNTGGVAGVHWVSCASAGNCAAVGGYADSHGRRQGFVASERHGAWHRAIKVPGLGALNTGGDAGVRSVSCASPWTCAAGGYYAKRTRHLHYQGFVSRS
jgi:hypothetical protein